VLQMGVDELAGYFSSQPRRPSPIRLDPDKVARGASAAKPCLECHHGGGMTIGPLIIPDLRGQPPAYLRNQMKMFKTNTRSPGDENLMKVKAVMNAIPDTTLDDLAEYFSSLR
jgi:cytochrome c553